MKPAAQPRLSRRTSSVGPYGAGAAASRSTIPLSLTAVKNASLARLVDAEDSDPSGRSEGPKYLERSPRRVTAPCAMRHALSFAAAYPVPYPRPA
nr:hypothetical protein [Actinomadura madurae]